MTPTLQFSAPPSPVRRIGLAPLMRLNMEGTDLKGLYQHLIEQATSNPEDSCSLLDASIILQFYGNNELAMQLQQEALRHHRHFRYPSKKEPKVKLLALMAPGLLMANIPVECLLEDSDIELTVLYATEGSFNPNDIPEHDVLLVAMSDQEESRPILDSWIPHLAHWPRPILNNPLYIGNVARDRAAKLLAPIPGVVSPGTLRISRNQLQTLINDTSPSCPLRREGIFPLLVRPIDSHAGNNLSKVDDIAALGLAINALPDHEFFITPFVDYRSNDGQFRKYRVMLIDGKPFIGHMAISSHWMIHYLNAGMAVDAEKRAEEARVMANFDSDFAQRHASAFESIYKTIGLDYLGIDCAETPEGELLVFEIEHSMVVHAMDSIELYPYKLPIMQKLFNAFHDMVAHAAQKN